MWKRRVVVPALFLALVFQLAAAQSPFTSGTRVIVETNRVKVRVSLGLNGEVVGTQEQSSAGTVVDASPFYADGYWWWQVNFDNGSDGWVAEGDGSEVFLGGAETAGEATAETEPDETVESANATDGSEVFVGDEMQFAFGADGTGSLTFQGQTYPVTVQETANGLTGTFNAGGTDFAFEAQRSGDTLTFVTDGNTYQLGLRGSTTSMQASSAGDIIQMFEGITENQVEVGCTEPVMLGERVGHKNHPLTTIAYGSFLAPFAGGLSSFVPYVSCGTVKSIKLWQVVPGREDYGVLAEAHFTPEGYYTRARYSVEEVNFTYDDGKVLAEVSEAYKPSWMFEQSDSESIITVILSDDVLEKMFFGPNFDNLDLTAATPYREGGETFGEYMFPRMIFDGRIYYSAHNIRKDYSPVMEYVYTTIRTSSADYPGGAMRCRDVEKDAAGNITKTYCESEDKNFNKTVWNPYVYHIAEITYY